MLCALILYVSGGTYSLTSTPNNRFLRNLFTLSEIYKHTYIIGHYIPSVMIIDLASHTTYVLCVNFMHKWQDLQFKVDSERLVFWEAFPWQFLLYSQSYCQKILYVFCFDVWPGIWTLALRLISQHTTY